MQLVMSVSLLDTPRVKKLIEYTTNEPKWFSSLFMLIGRNPTLPIQVPVLTGSLTWMLFSTISASLMNNHLKIKQPILLLLKILFTLPKTIQHTEPKIISRLFTPPSEILPIQAQSFYLWLPVPIRQDI